MCNCVAAKTCADTNNFCLQRACIFIPALCRCSPLSRLVGVGRKLGVVARIVFKFLALGIKRRGLADVRVIAGIEKPTSLCDTIPAATGQMLHGILSLHLLPLVQKWNIFTPI